MWDDNTDGTEGSFACDVVQQLAERLAERQDFSKVVRGKIGARAGGTCALAADLNDADDLAIQQNRCADHLLNRFGAFTGDFHAFENGGVPSGGKIILYIRPAIVRGACRKGRIARQWNKADL